MDGKECSVRMMKPTDKWTTGVLQSMLDELLQEETAEEEAGDGKEKPSAAKRPKVGSTLDEFMEEVKSMLDRST